MDDESETPGDTEKIFFPQGISGPLSTENGESQQVDELASLAPFALPARQPNNAPAPHTTKRKRKLLESILLFLCILLILRVVVIEPYSVPTGSMAPVLAGIHKAKDCPRCGYPVLVGHRGEAGDVQRGYATAVCPNCGFSRLSLDSVTECAGDHLLVDKTIFDLRRPHRWEPAVFRNANDQGKAYVKRVVGLPGECVQIRGGDLFIDRALCRKSLAECKAVRIPVFDLNYPPESIGWKDRWLAVPASTTASVIGTELRVDGTRFDRQYQWLQYRHFNLDSKREQAVGDGYAYNGGDFKTDPVHDFMLECDVEVRHGEGWVGLALTDGVDTMLAELRVGPTRVNGYGTCLGDADGYIRTAPTVYLTPGKTYHVEFAFVDRRTTLAIDGALPFAPVDQPEAGQRFEVKRPVKVGALGVEAVVRNVRLFRDIHYTQAGQHGIAKPYRLQGGEYFVLGDNSPNSDDSRFWDNPAVPEAHFLGKPFMVHLPTQNARVDVLGQLWMLRVPDWGRMRWLH